MPLSVISPRAMRSRQRCLFNSVQWLFLRRGERRWAHLPSGRRLSVLSIQPKQRASSTTSIYGMQSVRGILVRFVVTQHSLTVVWLSMNHWRNSARVVYSSRLVICIIAKYQKFFSLHYVYLLPFFSRYFIRNSGRSVWIIFAPMSRIGPYTASGLGLVNARSSS